MPTSIKPRDTLRGFTFSFIAAFVAVLLYLFLGLSGLEDRLGIDLRLQIRGPRPPHPDIVIVAVDEPSIAALGRWPWDRVVHARLIEKLVRAGAKVIAFDILFTESDQCGRSWSDDSLGRAAAASGRVVFGGLYHYDELGAPKAPLMPIPSIRRTNRVGLVNIFPETDGVTRKIPVLADTPEGPLPSLSFAAYSLFRGLSTEDAFKDLHPPVDDGPWHEMLVDYVGGDEYRRFPYYSFADVLRDKVPADRFAGKIVLVGGTAAGLFDVKSVPNISMLPGVEVHANALDDFLRRRFLVKKGGLGWTVLTMLAVGVLCGFLALRVPTWAGALSAGGLLAYFIACQELFTRRQIVLDYIGPTVGIIVSYVVVFFIRFRRENREKRRIRDTFSRYMSPEIVAILTRNPELVKLGGEDREMTVFFSDVAGFTTLSEAMRPQELVAVLNEYLSEMSDVVFRHRGVVDKYIGDAIMAFWNAPLDQPDHASLACFAALDQIEALKDLQRRFAERNLPRFDFRIGINTGHMVVGNMGSHSLFDYTVTGDAVNLAARLEGANKPFRSKVMISEFTYEKAKNDVEVRPLDLLRVKGKTVPIQVYELAARKGALDPSRQKAFDLYREGIALYRERKFDRAIGSFRGALALLPDDGPSTLYIERCEAFRASPPPPGWDGVFVMTTK